MGIYKGFIVTSINTGLGTGVYFYTYKTLKQKFFKESAPLSFRLF
jgi:hypothetical protein